MEANICFSSNVDLDLFFVIRLCFKLKRSQVQSPLSVSSLGFLIQAVQLFALKQNHASMHNVLRANLNT